MASYKVTQIFADGDNASPVVENTNIHRQMSIELRWLEVIGRHLVPGQSKQSLRQHLGQWPTIKLELVSDTACIVRCR
ncbi:MAG: hypothetical protein AAF637_26365, partial [Pseudomonadota bacterium]